MASSIPFSSFLLFFSLFVLFVRFGDGCSFLVTNKKIPSQGTKEFDHINFYLKQRGPDLTNRIFHNNFTFVHNLLSMTGAGFTPQPFVSEDGSIVALFNGEIYNYKDFGDYHSDGECLIPLYGKFKRNFVRHLSGEFSVVLFDFKKEIVVYSPDIFGIKPLWVATGGGHLGISSFESALKRAGHRGLEEADPNTIITRRILPPFEVLSRQTLHEFDTNQHKTTYDDWRNAFLEAVRIRIRDAKYRVLVPLSSGHDSGVIALAMNELRKPFTTMTIVGREDPVILEERFEILKDYSISQVVDFGSDRSDPVITRETNYVNTFVEPYECDLYTSQGCQRDYPGRTNVGRTVDKHYVILEDGAALGLAAIARQAKKNGTLVILSGCGGDEIMTDYGIGGVEVTRSLLHRFSDYVTGNPGTSCLKGIWPKNLTSIFPWTNFFRGTQRGYLRKEEHVSGSFGLESRYPFLDKNVVQEYLWLTPELKNSAYKAPLSAWFHDAGFPYKDKKVGFRLYEKGGALTFFDSMFSGWTKSTSVF